MKRPLPLADIETLIRQGSLVEARRRLLELSKKRIPRESISKVAALFRRVTNFSNALRLLNRYVRGAGRQVPDATDIEKTEYAANLIRLGLFDEAVQMLKEVDSTKVPDALLFEALAHFPEWNYSKAVPLLEAYVASPNADPYTRVIGQVNLASALIVEKQWPRAASLLNALYEFTSKQQLHLLHSNVLELMAQGAIINEKWEEAEKFLKMGYQSLKEGGSLDELYLKKWEAIYLLKSQGFRKASVRLQEARSEALKRGHWETLRDIDRHEAISRGDKELFLKLYYGTPYDAFRERLRSEFPEKVAIRESHPWSLHDQAKGGELDLKTGEISGKAVSVNLDGALLKLVIALGSDFYRPARLPVIYRRLYRGEYYHPDSSPLRVRQLIKRLRQWVVQQKIPLDIIEEKGFYKIAGRTKIGLRVYLKYPNDRWLDQMLADIRKKYADAPFSTGDAQKLLNFPRRSTARYLGDAVSGNLLTRVGQGRGAKYKFTKAE